MFYNAAQAARYIGVDDKTVRRWLKDGKITATRTPSNQLAIEASEVERIKRERDEERATFAPRPPMPTHAQVDTDILARVADLERRVAELESQSASVPTHAHVSPGKPNQHKPTLDIPPKSKPTKQPSTRNELPEGCILASKFAEQLGIPRRTFSDYLLLGLGSGLIGMSTDVIPQKEMIEYSERPKPGREHTGEKERYLTPEQQEKALELLRKHGKI